MRSGIFTFEAGLSEGVHQFKVLFYKATNKSSVVISDIEIVGSH